MPVANVAGRRHATARTASRPRGERSKTARRDFMIGNVMIKKDKNSSPVRLLVRSRQLRSQRRCLGGGCRSAVGRRKYERAISAGATQITGKEEAARQPKLARGFHHGI